MTAAAATLPLPADSESARFKRQLLGILRLELRRNLFSPRAFALYFLAFAPLFVVALWALSPLPNTLPSPAAGEPIFALIFEIGYVRVLIFLGSLLIFMSLFRAEILEQCLHYYFLTPVRREVLVLGKYLAAVIATGSTFALSAITLLLLFRLPWGMSAVVSYAVSGPGFGHLFAYAASAILASAGYGAVFLLAGLLWRNPMIPGALLWGWEALNPFLPAVLKKISVIHYLKAFFPIPLTGTGGLFEILIAPPPAWVALPGLLLFIALVLAITAWLARRMEVNYGAD